MRLFNILNQLHSLSIRFVGQELKPLYELSVLFSGTYCQCKRLFYNNLVAITILVRHLFQWGFQTEMVNFKKKWDLENSHFVIDTQFLFSSSLY